MVNCKKCGGLIPFSKTNSKPVKVNFNKENKSFWHNKLKVSKPIHIYFSKICECD